MLFSRRDIQRFICHNSRFMDEAEIKKVVAELNRNNRPAFHKEWEMAILYAVSQQIEFDYEKPLPSGKRPDLTIPGAGRRPTLYCDIACVSDEEAIATNPLDLFTAAFYRVARKKYKVPPRFSFDFKIEGEQVGDYRKAKTFLKIPREHEVPGYVKQYFGDWLTAIAREGCPQPDRAGPGVTVAVNQDSEFTSSSYPSFTSCYSLTGNPIYTQLENKRDQLAHNHPHALTGVILCDGGCQLLRKQTGHCTEISFEEIAEEQFRRNDRLDFIFRVWTEDADRGYFSGDKPLRLERESLVRAALPASHKALIAELYRTLDALPKPVCNSITAANRYRNNYSSIKHLPSGGMTMRGHQVEFSVNDLLRLLGGEITPEEFHRRYQIGEQKTLEHFFRRNREEGRTLSRAKVKRCAHEDDDRITLEFGAPDASRLPYRVPPLGL